MQFCYITFGSLPDLPLQGAGVVLLVQEPPLLDTVSLQTFFSQTKFDGLVLQLPPVSEACDAATAIVESLRSDPATQLIPVFCLGDVNERLRVLSDGIVSSLSDLHRTTENINLRSKDILAESFLQDADYRLLSHLHSRNSELEPISAPESPRYYTYPLAQTMSQEKDDGFNWLERLTRSRLLTHKTLVDRVRTCPNCDKAQLNYVDLCPDCGSVNIDQIPFLHCFTCGHIAPQQNFTIGGGLTCPNCRARLRHIGADYDRPLENYHCADCSSSFIDPHVVARCLHCATVSPPEDLLSYPVASYILTERGTLSVRSGALEDIYSLLDNLNYVHPKLFNLQLEWFLRLCQRYPDDAFSLIGIQLINVMELSAELGRQRIAELVDTYAARLRELVRSTDISTRSSRHTLWLLLPKTGKKGCEILHARIRQLEEATTQADGSRLICASTMYTASTTEHGSSPQETVELLLARLESQLSVKV